MDPRFFERFGPGDVGLLVEAGFQLHQHRHLFASLGGVDERPHYRRVARRAIQRHLDGEHMRIEGRLANEPLHRRGETVVGVMDQHIGA